MVEPWGIRPDRDAWYRSLLYTTREITVEGCRTPVQSFVDHAMTEFPWARRGGMSDIVVAHFQGKEWCWPTLFEWKVRFRDAGQAPRMWSEQPSLVDIGNTEIVAIDAFLLAHTIASSRRLFMEPASTECVRFAPPLTDEPPLIRKLESQMIAGYLNGLHNRLPPYWPGQRLGWSLVSRRAVDYRSTMGDPHRSIGMYRGGLAPDV